MNTSRRSSTRKKSSRPRKSRKTLRSASRRRKTAPSQSSRKEIRPTSLKRNSNPSESPSKSPNLFSYPHYNSEISASTQIIEPPPNLEISPSSLLPQSPALPLSRNKIEDYALLLASLTTFLGILFLFALLNEALK